MSAPSTPAQSHKRRRDGRAVNELRKLTAEFSIIRTSDGSARFSIGNTRVLAAIHGPRPARSFKLADPENAQLEISLIPPSGPAGPRELAMAAVIRSLFEGAIVRSEHPRTIITIAIHIQRDDGSCLSACINAVTLALVDACVPQYGLVSGVSAAILGPAAFVPPGKLYEQPKGGEEEEKRLALDASAFEEGLSRVPSPPRAPQAEAAEEVQTVTMAEGQIEPDLLHEQQPDVTGAEELLRKRAEAVPRTVQLHALATAAWISTEITKAAQGPACLTYTGNVPYATLQGMLGQMRTAATTVLAFLRHAVRRKIERESVHYAEYSEVLYEDDGKQGETAASAGAGEDEDDDAMES